MVSRSRAQSMSPWLLAIVSALYAGTGIDNIIAGRFAWGGFWLCYAIANALYIVAMSGQT